MSTSYSPNIVTNGLVLYLDAANSKSYVSGSNTWRDLSGNNISASLFNGPTFTSEKKGGITFDGSNDYATCANISSSMYNGFTINCWIKLLTVGGEKQYIGLYEPITFNEINAGIIFYNSKNTFFFFCRPGGGNMFSNTVVETNKLYYVSTMVNNITNKRRMYVNGALEQEENVSFQPWPNTITTIGAMPGPGRLINGILHNFSIYNRALSSQEILQNYNSTKGRYGL